MDADALAGMIFVLMIIGMVSGVIVLLPITMRLGKLLERRLEQRERSEMSSAEGRQLHAEIRSLHEGLEQLAERQAFTESLLAERKPQLLKKDQQS